VMVERAMASADEESMKLGLYLMPPPVPGVLDAYPRTSPWLHYAAVYGTRGPLDFFLSRGAALDATDSHGTRTWRSTRGIV
jgi:hypothetical protein